MSRPRRGRTGELAEWVGRHGRRVLVVLGVLAVVLAGATALLIFSERTQRAESVATAQALEVARTAAVELLSYDHRTVSDQLARADALLTGPFRVDYRSFTSQVVAPAAVRKAVDTHVQVVASSVVAAGADRVTALLFLNQISHGAGLPAPTITGSRVRIHLLLVDGRWLVSDLDLL